MVGASGVDLFISSDMFYLEIILEPSGAVKDVKIHHEGKVGYSQTYINFLSIPIDVITSPILL